MKKNVLLRIISRCIAEKGSLYFVLGIIVAIGIALLHIGYHTFSFMNASHGYNTMFLRLCVLISAILSIVAYGNTADGLYTINVSYYKTLRETGYGKKDIKRILLYEMIAMSVFVMPCGLLLSPTCFKLFGYLIRIYTGEAYVIEYSLPSRASITIFMLYFAACVIATVIVDFRAGTRIAYKDNSDMAKLVLKGNYLKWFVLGIFISFLMPVMGIVLLFPSILFIAIGIDRLLLTQICIRHKKRDLFEQEPYISLFLSAVIARNRGKAFLLCMVFFLSIEMISFGIFFGKSEEYGSDKYPYEVAVEYVSDRIDDRILIEEALSNTDYYIIRLDSIKYNERVYDLISRSDYNRLTGEGNEYYPATIRMANSNDELTDKIVYDAEDFLVSKGINAELSIESSHKRNVVDFFYTTEYERDRPLLILPYDQKESEMNSMTRYIYISDSLTNCSGLDMTLDELQGRYYIRNTFLQENKAISSRFYYMGLCCGITLFIVGIANTLSAYLGSKAQFVEDVRIFSQNGFSNRELKHMILTQSFTYVLPLIIALISVLMQVLIFSLSLAINGDSNLIYLVFTHLMIIGIIEAGLLVLLAMLLFVSTCNSLNMLQKTI